MKNITDVYANNYTLMLLIPKVKKYLYNTQFRYLYSFTVNLVRLALTELKWSKQWYFYQTVRKPFTAFVINKQTGNLFEVTRIKLFVCCDSMTFRPVKSRSVFK